jgi:hypothetical protein
MVSEQYPVSGDGWVSDADGKSGEWELGNPGTVEQLAEQAFNEYERVLSDMLAMRARNLNGREGDNVNVFVEGGRVEPDGPVLSPDEQAMQDWYDVLFYGYYINREPKSEEYKRGIRTLVEADRWLDRLDSRKEWLEKSLGEFGPIKKFLARGLIEELKSEAELRRSEIFKVVPQEYVLDETAMTEMEYRRYKREKEQFIRVKTKEDKDWNWDQAMLDVDWPDVDFRLGYRYDKENKTRTWVSEDEALRVFVRKWSRPIHRNMEDYIRRWANDSRAIVRLRSGEVIWKDNDSWISPEDTAQAISVFEEAKESAARLEELRSAALGE